MSHFEHQLGQLMPDFTLQNQHGQAVKLSELWEDSPVVVFFYPKDGTPVCTAQACSFRDGIGQFEQLGVKVVGVSQDTVLDHAQFAEKHALPYSILSDPNNDVRTLWKVPKFLGWMPGRVTYVLKQGGELLHAFTGMMQADVHVKEAIKVLNAL